MNNEEIQKIMAELQNQGMKPEDIADGVLWPLYRDGKMSREDLATLCSSIGLELEEDFENDEHADPIEEDAGEGVTQEEAEAAKEIAPGESKEEFQEKIEEANEGSADEGAAEEADEAAGEDEGAEEEAEKPEEGASEDEDEEWKYTKENIFKM